MRYTLRILILMIIALLVAACGTEADLSPTFEPTQTGVARLNRVDPTDVPEGEDVEVIAAAPTEEPTATTIPPTATLAPTIPPTEVPAEPTAEPTEEPTEEAAAPTGEAVVVNGVVGDPVNGESWFRFFPHPTDGRTCSTCHNPDEPIPGAGPYMYGIATIAGERQAGLTAPEYIYNSITHPNDFIALAQHTADGTEITWNPDVMPQDWADYLDDQMLADLVAYLMTLDQERPE